MSERLRFRLKVHHVGPAFGEFELENTEAYIRCWNDACSLLKERTLNSSNASVSLTINWLPIVRNLKRYAVVSREFHEAIKLSGQGSNKAKSLDVIAKKLPSAGVEVLIEAVSSKGTSGSASRCFVESFLHDVFLIMNLATPGSCNFYLADVRQVNPDWPHKRTTYRQTPICSLSETYFALAAIDGLEGKWPAPKTLPVKTVLDWFFVIRQGVSQLPKSHMERVLFSLLHIAKLGMEPTIVIWLCNALEALFDATAGMNRNMISARASSLLALNSKQAPRLKKKLGKLYEVRDKLAHGRLEVSHPLHNEYLDPSVDDQYQRFKLHYEFGFRLLLASIQAVIERGWQSPRFQEVISIDGEPIALQSADSPSSQA